MQYVARPDPDVVVTAMPDGDMFLLNMGTSQYFSLNATGALLWELLESPITPAGMSAALFERFEVTREVAAETVHELMRELEHHRLITVIEARD